MRKQNEKTDELSDEVEKIRCSEMSAIDVCCRNTLIENARKTDIFLYTGSENRYSF